MDPYSTRSPFHFPIARPVAVSMTVITAVVFGMLSYRLLPVNMMPEITYPSLTVRTEYLGSAPEEVENTVTRPLEQALGVVRNLVEISSSSRAGVSDILLAYDWGTNMNLATQEVREKLDLVFLPDDVRPPLILRYDPALDPLIRVGLTSDSLELADLRQLTEDVVKRELEKLPGVAAVKVRGGFEREIRIAVDGKRLDLLNLSLEELTARLAAENINVAGGRLREGDTEYIIRTLNEFRTPDEIGGIIIEMREGRPLRLTDVASVTRTVRDPQSITRVQGSASVEIEIIKESGANPVSVSDVVSRRLFGAGSQAGNYKPRAGSIGDMLSSRVNIHILTDQAEFVRLAIAEVRSAALWGGILAVLVLFLFLGKLRDTLIVAMVIPVSLICTFAAMHIAKVTLNIMSLGGLALGIGMMVDNAIVVIESIHQRREAGARPVEAAVEGTRTVGGAVTASTLTTIVVFFPIVFVTGVAGQIFGDMALTVVIALAVSLVVALFFIPMLTTRSYPAEAKVERESPLAIRAARIFPIAALKRDVIFWRRLRLALKIPLAPFILPYAGIKFVFGVVWGLGRAIIILLLWSFHWLITQVISNALRRVNSPLKRGGDWFRSSLGTAISAYQTLLRRLIEHPAIVIVILIVLSLTSYGALLPRLGAELIPGASQGVFNVAFAMPVGASVETTAETVLPLELFAAKLPQVQMVSTRSGTELTQSEASTMGPNNAVMSVMLKSGGDLEGKENTAIEEIRKAAQNIPSLDMQIKRPTLFTFKPQIELILKGDDLGTLRDRTRAVERRLLTVPLLADLESSVRSGYPEIVVQFDREKLARIGLSARNAAERVKAGILGTIPTRYREFERRVDIRVQLSEDERETVDQLRQFVINPGQAVPVMVGDAASLEVREGPAEIRHIGTVRAAVITASVVDANLKQADSEIRSALMEMGLAHGADYTLSGETREMRDSLRSLRFALLLAVFLVYVVMASQFESLKHPLLILLTIPLALAGVVPALWGFDIPLSVMVFLGLIVLAGIVVNNSIVLVDYANRLRRGGLSAAEAAVEAGGVRFRPILMTSLTTILALMPLALGVGEGVEMRRPMAVTVIFGLSFATLITLIAIPVIYTVLAGKDGKY